VPVGSKATVYVPAEKVIDIKENNKKIKRSKGISFQQMEEGYAVFKVNSGNYIFQSIL
jgi:alpha-L-rhamnosidase